MPTLSRLQIPPPKDWAEFEDITLTALRIRWNSPSLQKNGRSGQPQAGVDVWGPDNLEQLTGVQCKREDELTLATVKKEIAKAESFEPPLDVFLIATTAPPDAKLQAKVRTLSQQRVATKKFPVGLVYWEELIGELAGNPTELKRHFPGPRGRPQAYVERGEDARDPRLRLRRILRAQLPRPALRRVRTANRHSNRRI